MALLILKREEAEILFNHYYQLYYRDEQFDRLVVGQIAKSFDDDINDALDLWSLGEEDIDNPAYDLFTALQADYPACIQIVRLFLLDDLGNMVVQFQE